MQVKYRGKNITSDEYLERLKTQNFMCIICDHKIYDTKRIVGDKIIRAACIDHCHKCEVVRGLICTSCNTVLGFIEKGKWRSFKKKINIYKEIFIEYLKSGCNCYKK
jgi:hypothetical protein